MLKIALLDLNHLTRGVHTNTVPLGLGLISTYLKKNIEKNIDIKLFKEIDNALKVFKSWTPDIVGIAQYNWNSELNLYATKLVKKINPKCIVVAGGPNLDLSSVGKSEFLKTKDVDIGVMYDGEIPFCNIVKRILSEESIDEIKKNPPAGTYTLHQNNLIEPFEKPPRLNSLDEFGPIYSEGVFDDFLKRGYHPFVQTHRGCPFTCAFCHTSNFYYSKMLFLSPEIFRKDMEHIGKFFEGRHDVVLYMANTNMGLFDEDFEIAKIIKKIQEKYNWPRFIDINSGKDPKRLLDMLSIIKFQPAIALQTLTPQVLNNIKRKNIPLGNYCKFQQEVLRKTGETSATELILSLPGETKETFLETLKIVMNSGVQNIVIYTLMNLKGTPIASKEFAKKYCHTIKHRIVPRQFSMINGEKIFDTEEVIVSTKDMSFEDYLELRGISFVVNSFFSSAELVPLKKFLLESKVDIAKWIFNIHSKLSDYPDLYKNYESFLKETKEELFETREELIEFFNKEKNYNDLVEGKKGDNLLRKYKCIILSENYESYLKLAISEACKLIGKVEIFEDMQKYLVSRNMKLMLENDKVFSNKYIILNYDIPKWLESNKSLEEFRGSYSYTIKFTSDIKKKFNEFLKMNRDKSLSLQILYRDGGIRDLWPIWIKSQEN